MKNAIQHVLVGCVLAARAVAADPNESAEKYLEGASPHASGNVVSVEEFRVRAAIVSGVAELVATQGFADPAIKGSLTGPTKVELPRAGGDTMVSFNVTGLEISLNPVRIPKGISVTLQGNQLKIKSNGNPGPEARAGTVAIVGIGRGSDNTQKIGATVQLSFTQRPCHPLPCPGADPDSATVISAASAPAGTQSLAWSELAAALRAAATAGRIVRVLVEDTPTRRTPGSDIARIIQLCDSQRLQCALEVAGNPMPDLRRSMQYFSSADVRDALYINSEAMLISLRDFGLPSGEWVTASKQAITQLRASGLMHALIFDGGARDGSGSTLRTGVVEVFNSDPNRSVSFALSEPTSDVEVPVVVEPLATALIGNAREVEGPNGTRLAASFSVISFDAAGSAGDRFGRLQLDVKGLTRFEAFSSTNQFGVGINNLGLLIVGTTSVLRPSDPDRAAFIRVVGHNADGSVALDLIVDVTQKRNPP